MNGDPRKELLRYGRRARARLALVRGFEWTLRALFYASCAAVLAVVAHRIFAFPLPVIPGAAALAAAVLAVGLGALFIPPVRTLEAVAAVDRNAGWKERLSSAVALPSIDHPMEHALLEDALEKARRHPPSDHLPFRGPREIRALPAAAGALLLAVWLMPQFDVLGHAAAAAEKKKEEKQLESAIRKLRRKEEDRERSKKLSAAAREALKKVDDLAREFEKTPPSDRKDALAKITSLSEQLQKLGRQVAGSRALAEQIQKALEKAGGDTGELGRMLRAGRLEAAARELARLRNKLQEGSLTKEQREKLQRQMQELMDRLAERKDLSELEKKLAKAMQGLRQGDERMLEDFQDALGDLGQEMTDAEALADALRDLEGLTDALAQGQHECPSCGAKKDKPGEG